MPFEVTFMRLNLPLWRAMATSSTNCGCKVGSPMPCRVTKPVGGQPPRIRWNSCRSIRSEEHTSELQSLMRISYAVFCLKKKTKIYKNHTDHYKHTSKITRRITH